MSAKRDLEGAAIEPAKKTKKEIQAEEREAARIKREAEKEARRLHAEQQKQERELQRENERKEREQAKAEREKEKERLRKEKEREREEAKAERERQKERAREEKERQKELLKEQKQKDLEAQQPRLNTFFSVRRKEGQEEAPIESGKSDYHTSFLPYHHKATCTMHSIECKPQSPPESCLQWLASHPKVCIGPYISTAAFKQGLQLGQQTEKLMDQLRVKHIAFCETVRPTFVGTTADIDEQVFIQLSLDATRPLLETVDYEYDSDLEWTPGDDDDVELLDDEQSEEEADASDVESFLASDDDNATFSRRAPVASVDPIVKWNNHTEPEFFDQFKIIVLAPTPIQSGEYNVPTIKPTPVPKPDLPAHAVSEILKGIHGHNGTKALLLEQLYHDLHPKFSTLTRTGLRALIDSHAKREKTQWVVLEDKRHLMESSN